MNGIMSNTKYVNLSKVDDVRLNNESLVDENRVVNLDSIVADILSNIDTTLADNTYTKEEVNNLLANRAGFEIVDNLPTTNISPNKIYLKVLPHDDDPTDLDVYDEYIYINNSWEHVGSFQADFSNYYTKSQVETLINQTFSAINTDFTTIQTNFNNLKTHVGAIDEVLDAINGEVV